MTVSDADVEQRLAVELARISDPVVRRRAVELRVPPTPVARAWDYGTPGERFICWTVVEDRSVNLGIAYCDAGFGPKAPWGLVFLNGPHMSIGMDSGWFRSFEDAMRDLIGWYEAPSSPNASGSTDAAG